MGVFKLIFLKKSVSSIAGSHLVGCVSKNNKQRLGLGGCLQCTALD